MFERLSPVRWVPRCALLTLLLWTVGVGGCFSTSFAVSEDTDAHLNRAQRCIKVRQMKSNLQAFQAGLEKHEMDEKTRVEQRTQIKQLIERCNEIDQMEAEGIEQQSSKQELRDCLAKNPSVGPRAAWTRWWWVVLMAGIATLATIVLLALSIIFD